MDKREKDFVGNKYDLLAHQTLWYINKCATKANMTTCREKKTNKRTYTFKDYNVCSKEDN